MFQKLPAITTGALTGLSVAAYTLSPPTLLHLATTTSSLVASLAISLFSGTLDPNTNSFRNWCLSSLIALPISFLNFMNLTPAFLKTTQEHVRDDLAPLGQACTSLGVAAGLTMALPEGSTNSNSVQIALLATPIIVQEGFEYVKRDLNVTSAQHDFPYWTYVVGAGSLYAVTSGQQVQR